MSDFLLQVHLGIDEQNRTLFQLISYHFKTMQSILKPGTLKNYKTTEGYLKKFIQKVYKVDDMSLKQLNYAFTIDFEQFLLKLQKTAIVSLLQRKKLSMP